MSTTTDNTRSDGEGPGKAETLPVCPHLALRDDSGSLALYPRLDHVCRLPNVVPPSMPWQRRYCVSQHYGLCPHFQNQGQVQEQAPVRGTRPKPEGLPVTWRRAGAVAGALIVIGGGVVLTDTLATANQLPPPSPVATQTTIPAAQVPVTAATPGATAAPAALPTTAPTATATATPIPTPTSTPIPTPATTPSPEPTPQPSPTIAAPSTATPPGTYVVAEGDTLASIATRFNTSVDQLVQLNQIDDPNVIHVGTVLHLPTAP